MAPDSSIILDNACGLCAAGKEEVAKAKLSKHQKLQQRKVAEAAIRQAELKRLQVGRRQRRPSAHAEEGHACPPPRRCVAGSPS